MGQIETVKKRLIKWWLSDPSNNGLFPWRSSDISPYQALVTEVLLQRTRAEAVGKIFTSFFERFPDAVALTTATEKLIRQEMMPLGLLWRAAKLQELGNALRDGIPETIEGLCTLPGVGPYVAGAYLSLHRNKRAIIPDVNMARILGRVFGFDITSETRRKRFFLELCETITPRRRFKEFNYAILDFGRMICKPQHPQSGKCFLSDVCCSASIMRKD